jgi:hypothetical protein
LSVSSKSKATVPGLALKIKEYELIKLTFSIKLNVFSKSSSFSPG